MLYPRVVEDERAGTGFEAGSYVLRSEAVRKEAAIRVQVQLGCWCCGKQRVTVKRIIRVSVDAFPCIVGVQRM